MSRKPGMSRKPESLECPHRPSGWHPPLSSPPTSPVLSGYHPHGSFNFKLSTLNYKKNYLNGLK